MDAIVIVFIAFGLAMDAFAVSIASGVTIKHLRIGNALTIATFFGSFQAFMPLVFEDRHCDPCNSNWNRNVSVNVTRSFCR